MFQITLLAMGKLKEKFYLSAAAEYEKRLSGTCRFQLLELPECRLPETPQPAEIAVGLAREAELIRQKLPKGAWFCVFTPEGRELSSEAFASSSYGIDPSIKALADLLLSMGQMTFPHHLARVMVLEQLYRAEAIQSGSKYHK